ncbi:MAG: nucleotide sugar dehydrogenase [Bacteroidetes bacterium]|nr:nucleotide sugar dehydrogenase [Bacteroidota bacterium]
MSDTVSNALIERIHAVDLTVAVIGLGYVGLPLAVAFAERGFKVIGIDIDVEKVRLINGATSYVEDVPSERLAQLVSDGLLRATDGFDVLDRCDAVSICVPTPLRKTGAPDVSYILSATDAIAKHLHPGMLIVLESTTYPGTTTEVILPHFHDEAGGLEVGKDFFLCFSPERVDPGRQDWTTVNTPKVMGGVTPTCLKVGKILYESVIESIVPVSSTEVAELTKLVENTFRAVNIGLANEVLLICHKLGLNAWEVIEAAATKPFGYMKFLPGPGLGGHCIPIDPQYLSWKLRTLGYTARFIELATEINTDMPRYWVHRVQDVLNEVGKPLNGSKILVIGVAYKKNVGDIRESPALDILQLLCNKGAMISYHDPYVPVIHLNDKEMLSVSDLSEAIVHSDCVLIATDHDCYLWSDIYSQAQTIVDTRATLHQEHDQILQYSHGSTKDVHLP